MTAPKPAPPVDPAKAPDAPAPEVQDEAPAKAGAKFTNAEAAAVLRCYESEVASVDADGVATTTDGQRYLIEGDDYVWLRADNGVASLLGK